MTFAPDGRTLISSSQEGQVILWDLMALSKEEQQLADKLTAKQAEELWNDLQGDKAGTAIKVLRAAPKVSLPLLKEKLKPAGGAEQKKIEALIADLDSDKFDVRMAAKDELEKLAELAVPALKKALDTKPSLEVAKHIEELLEKVDTHTLTADQLRDLRALEVLENMKSDDATALLEKLAAGADGATLTVHAKAVLERAKAGGKK